MTPLLSELGTIAGVAVVVALLVQLAKGWIAEDKTINLFALIVGIVVAVAAALVQARASPVELAEAVLTGAFGGASAVGLYHVQKPINLLKSRADWP